MVELRIDSADQNGVGEILAWSPTLMTQYWGEDTSQVFDEFGWFRTGDLGRIDHDGFLYIVGRIKDIIIRGGENVAPANVEHALLLCSGVAECAVISLPHHDLGEQVAAVVVENKSNPVDLNELIAFARSRLASFECPDQWWIRPEPLPVNASGKVDKMRLQREWLERSHE